VQDDAWLERRYYGGDLPAAAERALHAVGLDWEDEAAAEGHIYEALDLAPGHLAVQLAAYKFYFYRHRLTEALPYARTCLAQILRRNQLPADWRDLRAEDAAFTSLDPEPRMVLFALVANGYVLARLGRIEEGRAVLTKVTELDPQDRMGARRLLAVIDTNTDEDDDPA
jgi:tetratricopeptide (TPR) repeat protein